MSDEKKNETSEKILAELQTLNKSASQIVAQLIALNKNLPQMR